ncbi:hypothetical protein RRG08_024386 [Elysia crispata]|uniref:Uncharacterized protein n=1 Tax=Elysia crispata TaxID=231223 RepID=A0AAE0ZM60_9GAST|nr:hypothetical protein RRG08_024386 [Elysia crispata]
MTCVISGPSQKCQILLQTKLSAASCPSQATRSDSLSTFPIREKGSITPCRATLVIHPKIDDENLGQGDTRIDHQARHGHYPPLPMCHAPPFTFPPSA